MKYTFTIIKDNEKLYKDLFEMQKENPFKARMIKSLYQTAIEDEILKNKLFTVNESSTCLTVSLKMDDDKENPKVYSLSIDKSPELHEMYVLLSTDEELEKTQSKLESNGYEPIPVKLPNNRCNVFKMKSFEYDDEEIEDEMQIEETCKFLTDEFFILVEDCTEIFA